MIIEHISASSIRVWDDCKLLFYAKKVLKIDEGEVHPATRIGSAVHRCMELASKPSIRSNTHLSASKDGQMYVSQVCKEYNLVEDYELEKVSELVAVCEDWGWWEGFDQLKRVEVEKRFLIDIGEGVKIKGFIDRLDIDRNGNARIIDIKTQAKPHTKAEVENSVQARLYNLAVRELYGIKTPIPFEWWTVKHFLQSKILTQQDADRDKQWFIDKGHEIMKYSQLQPPPPTTGKQCRWCAYQPECPAWM